MELVDFLRARLDEEEAAAKAAPGTEWTAFTEDDVAGASVYDDQWVLLYPQHYDHDEPLSNAPGATGPMYIERSRNELTAHIARHDPAHVLADIEAKRRIVDELEQVHVDYQTAPTPTLEGQWFGLLKAVALLTLPYADHPDYDESWRP